MHRRRESRSALALLAVTVALGAMLAAFAGGAAAARAAAVPQVSFADDAEPGWYLVKTSTPAPVVVTLEVGADCNFIRGLCKSWTRFPAKRFAAGESARVTWLVASFWGQPRNRAGKDELRGGFYRMTFAVSGKPASAVQTSWRLAFGD